MFCGMSELMAMHVLWHVRVNGYACSVACQGKWLCMFCGMSGWMAMLGHTKFEVKMNVTV